MLFAGDDRLVYGLPDNFALDSFREATLIQVCIGQHQVQLRFDGHRAVSIETRYTVQDPSGEQQEFVDVPAGAAALAALLGRRVDRVTGTTDGTLTLTFVTGATVTVYDDSDQYESYQINDGDRLIVV